MQELIENLKDVGCDEKRIEKICRLYSAGQVQDAIRVLRGHRCKLMERLHESQDKVDSLDFLVQRMEKEEKRKNGSLPLRQTGRTVF